MILKGHKLTLEELHIVESASLEGGNINRSSKKCAEYYDI